MQWFPVSINLILKMLPEIIWEIVNSWTMGFDRNCSNQGMCILEGGQQNGKIYFELATKLFPSSWVSHFRKHVTFPFKKYIRWVCFNDPAWESLWVGGWCGWHQLPISSSLGLDQYFEIHWIIVLIGKCSEGRIWRWTIIRAKSAVFKVTGMVFRYR